jgi:hypothetical protein
MIQSSALEAPSLAARPLASVTRADLLDALVDGRCLAAAVPMAIDIVEEDPLASAGEFAGDLLRGLMEVPGEFWGRHPRLYDRYREALRASAARRRLLPPERRMDFWEPLRRHHVEV